MGHKVQRIRRLFTSMLVNFVTVCSRPENLSKINDSIFSKIPTGIEVVWYVVVDTKKVSLDDSRLKGINAIVLSCDNVTRGAGNARNVAFDEIFDGYVHVIDDDNILHPDFYKIMVEISYTAPENIIVGHQIFKDGSFRLHGSPEYMHVGAVDTASIAWHRNLQGDIRWSDEFACDGIFVEDMMKIHRDKFVFANRIIGYYNYLR